MVRYERVINVFLASPMDVQEERNIAESVVKELNKTWSQNLNLRLDLIKWETDVYPGAGDYCQDVINEQINDEYDIFIAVFWGRIGSPTQAYDSGTIEELERAFKKHQKDNNSIDIMIYFKDQAIPPSKIDIDQLQKINTLKTRLKSEGVLYYSFENIDGFSSLLRTHLSKVAQKWADKPAEDTVTTEAKMQEVDTYEDKDENEDDYGLFDYIEAYEDKMSYASTALSCMADATEKIGSEIDCRTKEIIEYQNYSEQIETKAIKKLIKKTSKNMNDYCAVMDVQIAATEENRSGAFEALSKAISWYVDSQEENSEEGFSDVKNGLESLISAVEGTSGGLIGFRQSIKDLPRLTSDLNRSKRRTVKVLDRVLEECTIIKSISNDIIKTIEEIEK